MVQRLLQFGAVLLIIFAGVSILWDSGAPRAPDLGTLPTEPERAPAGESGAPPPAVESSPPAEPPPAIPEPLPPPVETVPPPPGVVEVPAVEPPALLPPAETIRLVFLYPGKRPIGGKVFLGHARSGRLIELPLRRPDVESADSITLEQSLERGDWRLLAHSVPAEGAADDGSWVAERSLAIAGGESIEIAFLPGATLEISARRREGGGLVPLGGAVVSLSPAGWRVPGRKWLYESGTDASGIAVFSGLPRGASLITSLDPGREVSSEAGSVEIERRE